MLQSLSRPTIVNIVNLAAALNAKHPPSEHGLEYDFSEKRSHRAEVEAYLNDARPLKEAIAALDSRGKAELIALITVARDGETDVVAAADQFEKDHLMDAGTVNYIAEKAPALPGYLTTAMTKLGI